MPKSSIHDFSKVRVAVVGDAMTDVWIYGHSSRISPEAPIPVFVQDYTVTLPGGAANVGRNVETLGAKAFVTGKSKKDWPVKTRHVCGNHHMSRVDREDCSAISLERAAAIINELNRFRPNAVIISDYAKGVCTPELCLWVIKWAKEHDAKVVVDPKGRDWTKYGGCDVITPNNREYIEASDSPRDVGAIVRTCGADGLCVHSPKGQHHIPALEVVAKDVTGCGDSVVAALVCALAVGFPLEEAARIANAAGGIAVSHAGTHAVTIEELEAAL